MSVATILVIGLALLWLFIYGEISVGRMLLGLLFATAIVWYTHAGTRWRIPLRTIPRRLYWLAYLTLVLLPVDLLRSNLEVLWRSRPGRLRFRPGIVRYDLPFCSPIVATLIAHAITIAPGEMLMDTSPNRCVLYIHVIDATAVPRRIRVWNSYLDAIRGVVE